MGVVTKIQEFIPISRRMNQMNLFSLQFKESFRAPQWEAKLSMKIVMGLVILYFIGAFVLGASVIYPGLNKNVLTKEPLEVFNSVLVYLFFFEFILRFFLQQLPVTNIQSLILLPLKKRKIINQVLFRSVFSGFNLTPFIIYLPFAISMYRDDYLATQAAAWWMALVFTTLCINFIIYIINKDNRFFVGLLLLLAATVALDYYSIFDSGAWAGKAFDRVVEETNYLALFVLLALCSYRLVYSFLKRGFYMDAGLMKKKTQVRGGGFAFLNVFGEDALFLKNDLRLVIRNARPRQIVIMSFLFLFYGLVFFPQEIYRNQPYVLAFAGMFVTGGFSLTFGNFVPAWDSSYYKLLMTQNLSYKNYLLSKWNLMAFVTAFCTLLAIPYVYFGWDVLAIIVAGSFFNIGLGTWITLFGGLLNKTPVKLNVKAKAFDNTQAFSLNQFFLTIPKMVLPVILYGLPAQFISPTAGIISLAGAGVLGILLRQQMATKITQLYIEQKHETIAAFNK